MIDYGRFSLPLLTCLLAGLMSCYVETSFNFRLGGKPLYTLSHTHIDAIKGHQLYRAFDRTVRLVQVM